jgi:hypothetical protein
VPVYNISVHPTTAPAPVHYPASLVQLGPVVQALLEVPPALAASLTAAGKQVPAPVVGYALIDTGASVSCIDANVPPRLGLQPTGSAMLTGAKGGGQSSTYAVRLVVQATQQVVEYQNMVEADLATLGYVALLGRDYLAGASLIYNGPTGEYTLST